MGVSEVSGRLSVAAQPEAELEERLAWHSQRREIDQTTAKLAREVRRVALLDNRRRDDIGREQIERHGAAQWLRTRQRQTVQEGLRVTVAETADIDEAVAADAEARYAAQSACDVALTRPGDVGGRQHREDLVSSLLDVAVTTTDDDDLTDRIDIHDLRCLFHLCLCSRGGRGGRRLLSRRGGSEHRERSDHNRAVSRN